MARLWDAALDLFGLGLNGHYQEEADDAAYDQKGDDGLYPIHAERPAAASAATCPLIRCEPRSMDDATLVADEIKRQVPVILNLEGSNPEEARRIRDFLGGVTYGLNGYMKKLGSWVYACAPFDMPIEKLVIEASTPGNPRYERDPGAENEY
jgi:cell division inhibitor SepF